jgi:nitrous oxidase accessory protein NosD
LQIWGTATVEDSSIHNEDIYESESSETAVLIEEGQVFLRRNRISIFHVDPYIPAHRIGDFCDVGVEASDGNVVIEGNQIVGALYHGISVFRGKASIQKNFLVYHGYGSGLKIGSAEATVEENTVIGMMPHGVGIQINPRAQATVRHNRISQNGIGIEVVGATAQLVENEVYANKNGIQLTHHWEGDSPVELVGNRVSQNEECGIAAHQYVEGKKAYEMFTGELRGERNEVQGNLQADLCPSDYLWPPGFQKP